CESYIPALPGDRVHGGPRASTAVAHVFRWPQSPARLAGDLVRRPDKGARHWLPPARLAASRSATAGYLSDTDAACRHEVPASSGRQPRPVRPAGPPKGRSRISCEGLSTFQQLTQSGDVTRQDEQCL